MYLGEFEAFAISVVHPAAMVANVQAMCRNFAELAKIYSPEQLDQGLWAIFATVRCGQYLFDPAIDSRLRIDCIASMYLPFRDVVALHTLDVKDSFYWMWWDEILHDLDPVPKEYKFGHATLAPNQSQMVETIFLTLSRILAIPRLSDLRPPWTGASLSPFVGAAGASIFGQAPQRIQRGRRTVVEG